MATWPVGVSAKSTPMIDVGVGEHHDIELLPSCCRNLRRGGGGWHVGRRHHLDRLGLDHSEGVAAVGAKLARRQRTLVAALGA